VSRSSPPGRSFAGAPGSFTLQAELFLPVDPCDLVRSWQRPGGAALFLDGRDYGDAWSPGPLVALEPEVVHEARSPDAAQQALEAVERLVAARRAVGGPAETGVAVLLAYDLFQPDAIDDAGFPRLVAWSVDRSVRFTGDDTALLTLRDVPAPAGSREAELDRLRDTLQRDSAPTEASAPARHSGRPCTSLPWERYLRAVARVRTQITQGEIYQANLSQRFVAAYEGDAFEFYANLVRRTPAPHSAFVATPRFSLASFSPETFLRMPIAGELETRPIKGTRPRGESPAADRAAARELVASAKDRAELLMIVDLERNDLARVCEPGSVEVKALAGLRTFPAVHHLVASVIGRTRPGTGIRDLLRATFPGGSITGAPKIRAMQILREIEPVSRNFFTGSLFWFGDDGTLDSSILIRTVVFGDDRVYLGAGGGIVADSDPQAEWEESNHKARSLTTQLGFDPREAS